MNIQIIDLVPPDREDETKTSSNILEQIRHKGSKITLWKPNPLESYLDYTFTPAVTGGAFILSPYLAFFEATASTSSLIPIVDHASRARRVNDSLRPAREGLKRFSNTSLVRRAVIILDELYNVLMKHDVKRLNSLMVFESEECIALEWIYPHWRIGFALDQNPTDDSWYLLSDDTAGDINASGNSILDDIDWIIYWLIKKL
jgi:hypothetical protein